MSGSDGRPDMPERGTVGTHEARREISENFDATAYWERRLQDRYSFQGVGNIGFSETYNRWMYRAKGHAFRSEVRRVLVDPASTKVLDVGSGTGFIVQQWLKLGASDVTSSDLTETAVRNLAGRFPSLTVQKLDIASPELPHIGPFDAISAMDVLYHIVDPAAYERAMQNVTTLLAPDGIFVFTEMFEDSARSAAHVSRGSFEELQRLLRGSGLELIRRSPLYVWMEIPARARGVAYRTARKIVGRIARGPAPLGAIGGALLLPIEILSRSLVHAGPGLQIFVCRKRR